MKEMLREESLLSKLDHPYILKYYESFVNNENMCIITEYCDVMKRKQKLKKHQQQYKNKIFLT
jgi:serine/threonine protein kinase